MADQNDVAQVLELEHRRNVLDVAVEVHVGVQQVGPLAQARHGRRIDHVALGLQEARHPLVAPAPVAAAVHEHVRRHLCLLPRGVGPTPLLVKVTPRFGLARPVRDEGAERNGSDNIPGGIACWRMRRTPFNDALVPPSPEEARLLLCALGDHVRDLVVASRGMDMAAVAGETVADTIYAVDRVADDTLIDWFEEHWPGVLVVSEGLDEPVLVGDAAAWTVIVDTIDGTED